MPKKSGQTALILVIVTMVTVLGIGVASSTQSNINLRNTVYSTQSEQALACAEAGAEKAIGLLTQKDPSGDGNVNLADVNTANSDVDLGSCTYTYNVAAYPDTSGGATELKIPKLQENTVQELKYTNASAGTLTINVGVLSSSPKAAIAVYVYTSEPSQPLVRNFYRLKSNDGTPTEFQSANPSGSGYTFSLSIPANTKYIRLRPLYSDLSITIPNYPNPSGFKIDSTGNAGVVQRVVEVYRFNSQLPTAFDEAVVMLDE